jgi:hypothetical protein
MNSEKSYKLIDGIFEAADANKILLELINNKINYHNRQIFSIKERFNGDASSSEKRIKVLLKTAKALKKTLESAQKKGLRVELHCPIEIKVMK